MAALAFVLCGCGPSETTSPSLSTVDAALCRLMPTARGIPSDGRKAIDAARAHDMGAMTQSANALKDAGDQINAQLKVLTTGMADTDSHRPAVVHLISIANFGVQGWVFFNAGTIPAGQGLQQFAVSLPLIDQEVSNLADALKAIGLGTC
jgi:hypothetical protein